MAPGRKSLRQLQIGKELVAGTSATPTVRMRWQDAVIEDGLELQELDEQIGILGGVARAAYLLKRLRHLVADLERDVVSHRSPLLLAVDPPLGFSDESVKLDACRYGFVGGLSTKESRVVERPVDRVRSVALPNVL